MKTPKDPRHQARKLALGEIYSFSAGNLYLNNPETKKILLENFEITNYDGDLFRSIVEGVTTNYDDLMSIIKSNSKNWDLSKMHLVDLSILLLAVWELKNSDTPPKVIVDEAVELSKEFGGDDTSKFVNGVLAGVIVYLKK